TMPKNRPPYPPRRRNPRNFRWAMQASKSAMSDCLLRNVQIVKSRGDEVSENSPDSWSATRAATRAVVMWAAHRSAGLPHHPTRVRVAREPTPLRSPGVVELNLRNLFGLLTPSNLRALEGAIGLCASRTHYEVTPEHWLYKLAEDEK